MVDRFGPLPAEAGQELAEEGLELRDTVLSLSRDQVDGKVLVLGMTSERDFARMLPLGYPVSPGAEVKLPPPDAVKKILIGDEDAPRLRLGTLIGRPNIDVLIKLRALTWGDSFMLRHLMMKPIHARLRREGIAINYPVRRLLLQPGDVDGVERLPSPDRGETAAADSPIKAVT